MGVRRIVRDVKKLKNNGIIRFVTMLGDTVLDEKDARCISLLDVILELAHTDMLHQAEAMETIRTTVIMKEAQCI